MIKEEVYLNLYDVILTSGFWKTLFMLVTPFLLIISTIIIVNTIIARRIK